MPRASPSWLSGRSVCACGAGGAATPRSAGPKDAGAGAALLPASQACQGSKHFGQGTGKSFGHGGAERTKDGTEGPGPGQERKARGGSWPAPMSAPQALGTRPLPGSASPQPCLLQGGGGAQLPHELVFRPWGRALISVSVNLGHILISLIVKKKNQRNKPNKKPNPTEPSGDE